jgi:peptidoglycan/LPS O-acetylase OafA/YrhL
MTDPQHQPRIPAALALAGTLAGQLARSNNRPAGFDYMRLVLAAGVIAMHTINTSYGQAAAIAFWDSPARLAVGPILPMFFALSGFLVAGSLVRCRTLVSFLGLRAIRIVPALAVEVLLSALILGPILTSLPLADYVASPMFHLYFLNIIGEIHYQLPGVFADNPVPLTVNGQLWTVPWELKCYAALAVLAVIGIAWHRRALAVALVLAQFLLLWHGWFGNPDPSTTVPGEIMVFAFLCGLLLFTWRDRVPWSPALFALSAVVSGALLLTEGGDWLVAGPIAYVTVFLGLLNPPRHRWALSGDYSYGIFLYGYPIQQTIASWGPDFRHWYLNLAIALPVAVLVATASWWLVEKPALRLKGRLVALESWLADRLPRVMPLVARPQS